MLEKIAQRKICAVKYLQDWSLISEKTSFSELRSFALFETLFLPQNIFLSLEIEQVVTPKKITFEVTSKIKSLG